VRGKKNLRNEEIISRPLLGDNHPFPSHRYRHDPVIHCEPSRISCLPMRWTSMACSAMRSRCRHRWSEHNLFMQRRLAFSAVVPSRRRCPVRTSMPTSKRMEKNGVGKEWGQSKYPFELCRQCDARVGLANPSSRPDRDRPIQGS
jgi:hypothetical protein